MDDFHLISWYNLPTSSLQTSWQKPNNLHRFISQWYQSSRPAANGKYLHGIEQWYITVWIANHLLLCSDDCFHCNWSVTDHGPCEGRWWWYKSLLCFGLICSGYIYCLLSFLSKHGRPWPENISQTENWFSEGFYL